MTTTPPAYLFLSGHRVDADGGAMAAVLAADIQQPSLFRDPQHFAISVEHGAGNAYTIHVYRHDTPDALASMSDVRVDVKRAAQPAASAPTNLKIVEQPVLLGTDVAAFLAAYNALEHSRFSSVDITAETVVVQQFVYLGTLRYGVAFTPKWHKRAEIGCDLQTMVDVRTFASQPITAVC